MSEALNWHLLPDPQSEQRLLELNSVLIRQGSPIDLSRTPAHLTLLKAETITSREIAELEVAFSWQPSVDLQEITRGSLFSAPTLVAGGFVICHALDPSQFLRFREDLRAELSSINRQASGTWVPATMPPHVTVGRTDPDSPSSSLEPPFVSPLRLGFKGLGLGVQGTNGTIVEQFLHIDFPPMG